MPRYLRERPLSIPFSLQVSLSSVFYQMPRGCRSFFQSKQA